MSGDDDLGSMSKMPNVKNKTRTGRKLGWILSNSSNWSMASSELHLQHVSKKLSGNVYHNTTIVPSTIAIRNFGQIAMLSDFLLQQQYD